MPHVALVPVSEPSGLPSSLNSCCLGIPMILYFFCKSLTIDMRQLRSPQVIHMLLSNGRGKNGSMIQTYVPLASITAIISIVPIRVFVNFSSGTQLGRRVRQGLCQWGEPCPETGPAFEELVLLVRFQSFLFRSHKYPYCRLSFQIARNNWNWIQILQK
jgi:hypothetical protein